MSFYWRSSHSLKEVSFALTLSAALHFLSFSCHPASSPTLKQTLVLRSPKHKSIVEEHEVVHEPPGRRVPLWYVTSPMPLVSIRAEQIDPLIQASPSHNNNNNSSNIARPPKTTNSHTSSPRLLRTALAVNPTSSCRFKDQPTTHGSRSGKAAR